MTLIKLRYAKNMTQKELADASGVSRSLISMYEIGKTGISVETAKRLADVLDCDWTVFFS